MKYDLLQTLLPHLDAYEKAYPKHQQVQHFAVWLARQAATADQVAPHDTADNESAEIGKLLVFLHRYAKNYAKKALDGSVLGGVDEFVYLTMLQNDRGLTKSELIYQNRHEKPTGMEIIRRLLAAGLVEQSDDLDDRRSKRLRITPEGQEAVTQVQVRMNFVRELLTGNLNGAEKMLLLQMLEKMELFHQIIQAKTKGGDFEATVQAVRGSEG